MAKRKFFEITKDDDLGKELGLWIDEKLVRHPKKKQINNFYFKNLVNCLLILLLKYLLNFILSFL